MLSNNNKQYTSSSLFSLEYKIPYDQRSQLIAEQIQQSQSELQFLKKKLTQTYQKLEQQITCNTQLQNINHELTERVNQLASAIQLQKKQNYKIKEVLEKIIQNRKILERQLDTINSDCQKKIKSKTDEYKQIIEEKQLIIQRLKHQHQMEIQQIYDTQRKQIRSITRQIQAKYQNKIQALQKQIQKITNQKVTQITRLKHQLKCYQSQSKTYQSQARISLQKNSKSQRNRAFKSYRNNQYSNNNIEGLQHNQNTNILQTIQQQNVGKWVKKNNKSVQNSKILQLSDDQQLTNYQIQRKKVQCQLNKLERIKRPTQEQRQKTQMLEKQIYELDSLIAGLKRKIRQKY